MSWSRPRVVNHRGRSLPASLGLVIAVAGAVSTAGAILSDEASRAGVVAAIGSGLVFAAGFVDDLSTGGPRGLRAHLRALLRLHVTTGVIKLVVITATAIVVAASLPHRGVATLGGVVLMAAAANLWNGLDVRPGRALKGFLPVAAAVVAAGVSIRFAPAFPGVVLGAMAVLPFDLRERAVLGDGGANLLGFTLGLGLYLVLPGWGVWLGAAVLSGLNVLADTVTLSRAIDASPPLRWFDELGRLPAEPSM